MYGDHKIIEDLSSEVFRTAKKFSALELARVEK